MQIVSQAQVEVEGEIVGQIGAGMLLLVGVEADDSDQDLEVLIDKIVKMRTFVDPVTNKFFERSIGEVQGEALIVSQFTIPATFGSGRRPEFSKAMNPKDAKEVYDKFVERFREVSGVKVETGVFGAKMNVGLINDGPITYVLNSKDYV